MRYHSTVLDCSSGYNRDSESLMSVALDTTKDEKTERLSHPPALGVLCWGFPPGPRQMGLRPIWKPPQEAYFHTNDILGA